MIEGVEILRTELQSSFFAGVEAFEEGGVEIVKSRATYLVGGAAERRKVGLPVHCYNRGSCECFDIEPIKSIVRTGIGILSWDQICIAAKIPGCRRSTSDADRLACLSAKDVVDLPSSDKGICYPVGIAKEVLATSEGQPRFARYMQ